MSCTLNITLGPSRREQSLEADLQGRIDAGHKVWAVGDIHGHLATFRALLHRLQLRPEDRVICLGDMIDRGPDSAGLVALLRSDKRIICLKGNHELMAIQCLTENGGFEAWQPWMKRGGKSTYGSYIARNNGDLWQAKKQMISDLLWMKNLPNQLVLRDLRLVHAGYDPRKPLDCQGEKELLWIRKRWFNHDSPVDEARSVIFGHSTTTNIDRSGGEIAHSKFDLADGRPAWIAVDVGAFNHVTPSLVALDLTSIGKVNESKKLKRLKTQKINYKKQTKTKPKRQQPFKSVRQITLKSERWFDVARTDAPPISLSDKSHRRGKTPKRWKCADDRKEAHVADSFGLAILQINHRRELMSEIKKQRRLRMAGLVLSSSLNEFSLGINSLKSSSVEKSINYTIYRKKLPLIHSSDSRISQENCDIKAPLLNSQTSVTSQISATAKMLKAPLLNSQTSVTSQISATAKMLNPPMLKPQVSATAKMLNPQIINSQTSATSKKFAVGKISTKSKCSTTVQPKYSIVKVPKIQKENLQNTDFIVSILKPKPSLVKKSLRKSLGVASQSISAQYGNSIPLYSPSCD